MSSHWNWKWYVYILKCNDNSYYVGMTWKPEIRLDQHLSGFGGAYTRKNGAKSLEYLEEFEDIEEAKMREKQIKGWTRVKKEKLISGKWGKI